MLWKRDHAISMRESDRNPTHTLAAGSRGASCTPRRAQESALGDSRLLTFPPNTSHPSGGPQISVSIILWAVSLGGCTHSCPGDLTMRDDDRHQKQNTGLPTKEEVHAFGKRRQGGYVPIISRKNRTMCKPANLPLLITQSIALCAAPPKKKSHRTTTYSKHCGSSPNPLVHVD